jgi:hypothetical protein
MHMGGKARRTCAAATNQGSPSVRNRDGLCGNFTSAGSPSSPSLTMIGFISFPASKLNTKGINVLVITVQELLITLTSTPSSSFRLSKKVQEWNHAAAGMTATLFSEVLFRPTAGPTARLVASPVFASFNWKVQPKNVPREPALRRTAVSLSFEKLTNWHPARWEAVHDQVVRVLFTGLSMLILAIVHWNCSHPKLARRSHSLCKTAPACQFSCVACG